MGIIVLNSAIPQELPSTEPTKGKKILDKVAKVEHVSLSVKVASAARYAINCFKEALSKANESRFPNCMKLAVIAMLPFYLFDMVQAIKSIAGAKLLERIDAGLKIVANIGAIGDAISTVAEGLAAVGAVALKAIKWATPLFLVSLPFEAFGMVVTGKSLGETHRFKKLFDQETGLAKKLEEYSMEDFRRGLTLIDEKCKDQKQFIAKHFRTNEEKFADRLIDIETKAHALLDSGDEQQVLEGKKMLKTTMELLSKRMSAKIARDSVSLTIDTVGFVGVGLLFSPAVGVGFGVLALSGVASIGNYIADKVITKRFEKRLGY